MRKTFIYKHALPIGLLALASGLILKQFFDRFSWAQFAEGFLFGLSIVFIVFHLISVRQKRNDEETN